MTLRGELPKEYDALVNGIANKAKSGAAQGLQCAISFIEPFPATVNHEDCVKSVFPFFIIYFVLASVITTVALNMGIALDIYRWEIILSLI